MGEASKIQRLYAKRSRSYDLTSNLCYLMGAAWCRSEGAEVTDDLEASDSVRDLL